MFAVILAGQKSEVCPAGAAHYKWGMVDVNYPNATSEIFFPPQAGVIGPCAVNLATILLIVQKIWALARGRTDNEGY